MSKNYSYSIKIEIDSPGLTRAAILKKQFENKVKEIDLPDLSIKEIKLDRMAENRSKKTDLLLESLTTDEKKIDITSPEYIAEMRKRIKHKAGVFS